MDIDYVVPMVFDDDEQWRKDYVTAHHVLRYGGGNVRYRSWGNEELLIRCIRKFMPFVRTIYIILARESQKKAWMDDEPFGEAKGTVRVVYHREFVPEKYLPCFNSCTLEMFVPFIEGLSEHFIYGNDDMFPVSPLKETDFFVNGLPVQHLSEKAFSDKPGIFQRKCKRQQEIVAGALGKSLGGRWLKNGHGLAPMLKSACLEARERFDKEVTSGITLHRSETSYNQYLYVLWQYFTGRCVDGRVESTYLSVKDAVERVRDVLSKAKGVVCMNDHEEAKDVTEYASVFRSEIERRLSMRVALVAIGRMENDYASEFVGHHLSVGFDKVVIYDNNRRGEEHFEDVLQDYIVRGQVEVVDYRDREAAQRDAYNDAYQRLSSEYDWIAFFDFDEFLCFADGESSGTGVGAWKPRCTVKGFLEGITQEFDAVMVPWVVMTDNGHVRKDGRPLMERFTESMEQARVPGKCIVRGGIKDLRFVRSVHVPGKPVLRCCSPSGEPVRQHREQKADTGVCYLKHFCTKTIEEWLSNKWKRGTADRTKERFERDYKDYFFRINKRTPEKEAFIREWNGAKERIILCAIGRMENEYAREFVEYYLGIGVDQFVIIDNNYDKEEHFEDVLGDYIAEGKVTIENYRNRQQAQMKAYEDVYRKYGSLCAWMAFFDFDEFLVVNGGLNIKEWLHTFPPEADEVLVNWRIMTDNGHYENDGRAMIDRFTEPMTVDRALKYQIPENNHVKCIIRGGLGEVRFEKTPHSSESCVHCYHSSSVACDSSPFYPYDYSSAYLLHFSTKTIGEWMRNKWQKGVGTIQGDKFKRRYSEYFFGINERTPEKEAYIKAYEQNRSRQLVVCIVHYNTPELTLAAIRSLWKHSPGVYVIVFDNSDSKPFPYRIANVEVIDNTKGQHINFDQWLSTFPDKQPIDNDYASAKHCYSVQWLIAHRRRPFLLMDSDVLVKKDIVPLFNSGYAYVGEEKMHKSRFGNVMRVLPFLCYIDVPMVKQNVVSFYHPKKMFALSSVSPDNAYDTGCWFYEDCHQHQLPVCSISISDYAVHFGHGSWKDKDASEWLEAHETLWK